ncbi:SGNH/GDSL hydrolase family protein [Agromyces tropicus]|uniref:SGNH/GDSL hydrolase family protein n=2 Tax=Agromyces tropicus TaxID=555371 RepID=A0ABP5FLL7_9MICO
MHGLLAAIGSISVLLLAGCAGSGSGSGSGSGGETDPTESPTVAAVDTDSPYPDSVAVLGHSAATGANSDPDRPGQDALENSWATGSNPDVRSVASRVAEENPAAAGRAWNYAVDGSGLESLKAQARKAVATDDVPELFLIVTVDNDMRCDGTDAENYEPFAEGLGEVLDTLEQGAPDSRVMIVSQWGTVQAWADAVYPVSPATLGDSGPCGLLDPETQQLDPARIDGLQSIVEEYQARVDAECAARSNCETDGGAARALPVNLDTLSSDLNHLALAGHAALAELVWQALFP